MTEKMQILKRPIKIIITFLLAMMLAIFPLPEWLNLLQPLWVVMLMIYWVLNAPQYVGVGCAWFIGLLLDVLTGTVLGVHALALVIISYIVIKISRRMQLFSVVQQSLTIFMVIILYQAILFWVQAMAGSVPITWYYWLPSLTSAIFWPLILKI